MIGVGTDIVEISRVEAVWRRQGERFVQRILVPAEREILAELEQPWRFLAKRFAAKEAVAKSFGTGIGAQISWQDMQIVNDSKGAPLVLLSEQAQEFAHSLGATQVKLSLADEHSYAVAFAILCAANS